MSPDELAAMRADDALLDALGRGEPVARDDELAAMLGAWRAEMDTEPLPTIDVGAVAPSVDLYAEPFPDAHPLAGAAASETGVSDAAGAARVRPAVGRAAPRPRGGPDGAVGPGDGSGPAGAVGTGPGRVRSRRWPRGVRLGLVLALVIAAAGGVSVAADRGGPDGPLWTVVRLVDPDRADLREAQDAVAKARKAVEERRYADARGLIDRADGLVAKVRAPAEQAKLRAELDVLRRSLPAGVSGVEPGGGASTGPTAGPVPGPTTAPAPGQPGGPTGTPATGQTGGGGLLPPLLPSSPAPLLPTCLLPSILPTGPLLPGLPPVCK